MYLSLEETPLNVITEKKELENLLHALQSATEFAVDLEVGL